MNLTLIPLLIAALMLATIDSDTETVEILMSGEHEIVEHRGALIVGDADVTIPAGVEVEGPIYVIGGELSVSGGIRTDLIQLAGTIALEPEAIVGDELRLIGGSRSVAPEAIVGRITSLEIGPERGSSVLGVVLIVILALILAAVGSRLARSRRPLLDNVTGAVTSHPVVSLTVGVLVTLTALAAVVFMAFTLILIPLAIVGLVAGVVTIAYGLVAWGHLLGSWLPIASEGLATGAGVVMALVGAQILSFVPVVGDMAVLALALTAVGAVVVTYYGVAPFRPAVLPE